ncbi:MAG: hypothetical protein HY22_09625 [[Candidatus Thermochlorobacteriaceae] bacterium GBChlB]|jgi:hypothetical protein|nr:MAG: hypothetical protein HY22_09625 [[Candidatus Thermochlorobacteriaceae] bacterium GBChlB]
MVKEKRPSVSKPKNGRHKRATIDAARIEPVLRMLSALTDTERAAVKHALDKAAWEEKILASSRAEGGVSFTFAEITAMNKMSSSALSDYLNQKVHAKHTLQAGRTRTTA